MTLYEAIYNRKSVRNYRMVRMSSEFFNCLDKYMETITPLYPEIRCHMDVVCALDSDVSVKGMFHVKAPYYIVIRSEDSYEAFENAGYILQYISLYLTSKEIGSCYQGGIKISYNTSEPELIPCMVLAFGYTDNVPLREASRSARKNINKICTFKTDNNSDMIKLAEAARLAPSAFNRQPWRFVVYSNRIHIFERRDSEISQGKVTAVDMGIVQCHFMVAAEEMWLNADLVKLEHIVDKDVKKHKYIKTVLINNN